MKKKILSLAVSAMLLAGCTNEAGKANKANIGMVGGALGGALLGSQLGGGGGKLLTTAAGAALGGFAGRSIGSYMDNADLQAQKQAHLVALQNNRDGAATSWHSKNSNASGSVTPTKSYVNNHNSYCREYIQNVTISGKTERAYGKACKRPNGDWQIVQ